MIHEPDRVHIAESQRSVRGRDKFVGSDECVAQRRAPTIRGEIHRDRQHVGNAVRKFHIRHRNRIRSIQQVSDIQEVIVETQREEAIALCVVKTPSEVVPLTVGRIFNPHLHGKFHDGKSSGDGIKIHQLPDDEIGIRRMRRIESDVCRLSLAVKTCGKNPVST